MFHILCITVILSFFFSFGINKCCCCCRGKIHKFLWLLAVGFSTSCGFLQLDFQLLAFRMFLQVKRKNKTFLRLVVACVFLRHKNFLRHFLRVHYFWAVLYRLLFFTFQKAIYLIRKAPCPPCGTFLFTTKPSNICTKRMCRLLSVSVNYISGETYISYKVTH